MWAGKVLETKSKPMSVLVNSDSFSRTCFSTITQFGFPKLDSVATVVTDFIHCAGGHV